MSECELCNQGDPSINVRCWCCRELFHLHRQQYDQVEEGTVILADCPRCGTTNCWIKTPQGIGYSGLVICADQEIEDMRRK